MRFWPEASFKSARSWRESFSKSSSLRSPFTASAPMVALYAWPYFSRISRYSASVSSCFFASGVVPGSMTT